MDTVAVFPLVLAMLGVLPSARVATEPALFDIQIHLQLDQSITRKVLIADVQDEAERIWRPYGVRITWPDSKSPAEPFSVTAILAWEIERSGVLGSPLILGRAFIDPMEPPRRPIRVSIDATEQTLALRPHSWTSIAGRVHERELARALGRVLAHEIGHVLLAVRSHDQTGLMREAYTADELARPDRLPFVLTANSAGRLRSRIERLRALIAIGSTECERTEE
jgi:hypothetical protein